MRFLGEDIELKRNIIDLGVIIEQEEISLYESKTFGIVGEGVTPYQVKLPINSYTVQSLISGTVYRNCVACSEIGVAGFSKGDVVVIASINDIFFVILSKVDWLSQKRIELKETDRRIENRKVFTNEDCSVVLEPSGEVVIRFKIQSYDNYVRFGGYSPAENRRMFLSLVSSGLGEILRISPTGKLFYSSKSDIEVKTEKLDLTVDSFELKAISENSVINYDINGVFLMSIKDEKENEETLLEVLPSEWHLKFGKHKELYIECKAKESKRGSILISFKDTLRVEMNGDLGNKGKFVVYSGDYNDELVEKVAKAETLKKELDRLRNELQNFIQNIFNTHQHTGNLGFPTSPPLKLGSSLSEFTEKWFSETTEVE